MPYSDYDYSDFIPELWSQRLKLSFEKSCVMRGLCNTDYEGEIRNFGDTVKIRGIGDVTVKAYTRGMTLANDTTTPTLDTMTIDQPYYFRFDVDDLDAAQADLSVIANHTNRAAYKIKAKIDTLLLASFVDASSSLGTDTVPINLGTGGVDVYDQLVELNVKLDEKDVSPDGRWLVVPPRVAGVIMKHDYFADASKAGDGGMGRRTGMIGQIAGFDIFKSSNLVAVAPPTSALGTPIFACMAGTNDAISFAMQVTKMEAARPADSFITIIKGLVLFGFKTVNPDCLCSFKVNSTTI